MHTIPLILITIIIITTHSLHSLNLLAYVLIIAAFADRNGFVHSTVKTEIFFYENEMKKRQFVFSKYTLLF